ncbi:MAG: Clp protease ClpP [Oscillospiraceae bacterium]|nr:Clp protease ClpP [Oscillospiraceae bacterium]
MKYYNLAETDGALEVFIYGDITSWPWIESDVDSYTLAKTLAASDAKTIHVRINSYGGEVAEALAIYSALRRKSAEGVTVKTTVDGFACSAASMVFMAGDEREVYSYSLLMIHKPWTWARGNDAELHKAAEDLEKISAAVNAVYLDNAAVDAEKLEEMLSAETWLSADDALTMGFATVARSGAGKAAASISRLFGAKRQEEREKSQEPRAGDGTTPSAGGGHPSKEGNDDALPETVLPASGGQNKTTALPETIPPASGGQNNITALQKFLKIPHQKQKG